MKKDTHRENKKPRALSPEEREHAELLREVVGTIAGLRRRDTDQAYVQGQELARAKSVLPDRTFGHFVTEKCGCTPRLARGYVAIFENLQPFRDRFIACAAKPTILLAVAHAEPAKIEAVAAAIEANGRMTVAQVKAMLKDASESTEDKAENIGGRAGLMRAAQEQLKSNATLFAKEAALVLKEIEAAVAVLNKGKNVAKSVLAGKIEDPAGRAYAHLVAAIDTDSDTDWKRVQIMLARITDAPRWPNKAAFPRWLADEILPALRFAVRGTPLSQQEAIATVPRPSAAAVPVVTGDEAGDDDGALSIAAIAAANAATLSAVTI